MKIIPPYLLLSLAAAVPAVHAGSTVPPLPPDAAPSVEEAFPSFRIDLASLYEFGETTSAGPSGDVFQTRASIPFLATIAPGWRVLGFVGGSFTDYETDPFEGDGIQTWGLSALVTIEGQLTEATSVGFGGIGSASWEDGASFSDSLNGGGLALISYRFSPTLKVGVGGLYLTRLNEDALAIPALGLDWQPVEKLDVTLYGLNLRAQYELDKQWSVYLRGEYDPGGSLLKDRRDTEADSYDDQGIRAAAGVTWTACRNFSLSLEGGVAFHEYTLRNEREEILAKDRIDPAPFVGVAARLLF